MKYSLSLHQNLPFAQCPAIVQLEGEKIVCNDVHLPQHIEKTFNPHNVQMYVIGHEYGPICAVFASNDQAALDNAVDANMLDSFMAENQDHEIEQLTPLGDASELFDLSGVWLSTVCFEPVRDLALIVALVRASESGADVLQ